MTSIAKKRHGSIRRDRKSKPVKKAKRVAPIEDGQIDSFLAQMDDPDYWYAHCYLSLLLLGARSPTRSPVTASL